MRRRIWNHSSVEIAVVIVIIVMIVAIGVIIDYSVAVAYSLGGYIWLFGIYAIHLELKSKYTLYVYIYLELMEVILVLPIVILESIVGEMRILLPSSLVFRFLLDSLIIPSVLLLEGLVHSRRLFIMLLHFSNTILLLFADLLQLCKRFQ